MNSNTLFMEIRVVSLKILLSSVGYNEFVFVKWVFMLKRKGDDKQPLEMLCAPPMTL